ncbi:MAG: cytochrome-c oxidase, cbb3-type subunit I, partial [Pseudomonadota bacterium]
LMWREYGSDGFLVNSFIDTVDALGPMYLMRASGGALYLIGAIIMAYNIGMTIAGRLRDEAPMGETRHDEIADRPLQPEPAE